MSRDFPTITTLLHKNDPSETVDTEKSCSRSDVTLIMDDITCNPRIFHQLENSFTKNDLSESCGHETIYLREVTLDDVTFRAIQGFSTNKKKHSFTEMDLSDNCEQEIVFPRGSDVTLDDVTCNLAIFYQH